jgi:hypothetical protein
MMKFPIYGKIKNVPNHQPENLHLLIRNPPKKTNTSLDRSPISSGLGKYAHKRWHHVIITAGNGPAMKLILHTLRC